MCSILTSFDIVGVGGPKSLGCGADYLARRDGMSYQRTGPRFLER